MGADQSLPNGDTSGIFYANQLGYLTPRKDWRHWQLTGARQPPRFLTDAKQG